MFSLQATNIDTNKIFSYKQAINFPRSICHLWYYSTAMPKERFLQELDEESW